MLRVLTGPILFGSSIAMYMTAARIRRHMTPLKAEFSAKKLSLKLGQPIAKKLPVKNFFGVNPNLKSEFRGDAAMNPPISRDDDYFWLRDETRRDPKVIGHLKIENEYCEKDLSYLKGFREKLYNEMLSHLKETDEDVPHRDGNYFYYSKTVEGLSYKIHCRKHINNGEEEVILDENKLAEGHEQCDICDYAPSPSHNMIAYGADFSGYETYTVRIVEDPVTGKELEDVIEECDGTIVWGGDDSTVFYLAMDEQHRPNRVYLHILGTPQSDDLCVYTEEDPLFWLGLDKTANDRFVVISSGSKETSECHVIDLNGVIGGPGHLEAAGRLALVKQRQFGLRYEVEQHGDHFYFITNADGAKNNKLVRTPVSTVLTKQQGVWEDVRAYNPAEQIDDIHVFSGHIAIFGREEGVQRLWTVDLSASVSDWHAVPFSEVAYSIGAAHNCVFDCDTLRLTYSSFVTPKQVLDYNMSTQATAVLKVQEVPHYNASQYECVRIHAPSEDGTRSIPMSVVYNKKVLRASTAAVDVAGAVTAGKAELVNQPTILYGYGSYGACIDPSFDFKRTALLDRGVVYVIAHIRGGGEMGRAWYEDEGKYLTKRNTFSDFAACARHLVDQKITASDRLAIVGRSAGGLLIGAVCNMYPSLFKAAVADVPFVDVLNTMSDPTIPLTVVEWEEWGNPNEEKYHDYMRSYSPYDNVARQEYPAMLVTAGLNDPRVPYWEPAKWVAKLRAMKTDGNPLYLKTDLTTGHFSASDRYKYIKETAFEYAFMLDQIGAKLPI